MVRAYQEINMEMNMRKMALCLAALCAALWTAAAANDGSSPAVANGMVYVTGYDHNVYAYALNARKRSRSRTSAPDHG